MNNADWESSFIPLLKKYKKRKHPLDYKNRYQLLVMVILSAQDSDKHINELAPSFFAAFPSMTALAMSQPENLYPFLNTVRNFANKCNWLTQLAKQIGEDSKIPLTLSELIKLPGIGRKSANVILRESGCPAEGIIVDLHVVRVAPRIGIASGTQPEKIEKQLMAKISPVYWSDLGMAISFLGREICRPTHPKCDQCPMNTCCYQHNGIQPSIVPLLF